MSVAHQGEPDISLDEAMVRAIRQNDARTLRKLLKKRKRNRVPLAADERGWTALHLAASRPESKECLELLLQLDDSIVNLNAQTVRWRTAIYSIATKKGCEENVLLLLQRGCKPYKFTELKIAASQANIKIVEYLLKYLSLIHI